MYEEVGISGLTKHTLLHHGNIDLLVFTQIGKQPAAFAIHCILDHKEVAAFCTKGVGR